MNSHLPPWAPDEADFERPSPARMYDFYLGGSHNFAADRAMAQRALEALPDLLHVARANRAFLRRAVTFLAEAGIDQFLDLGSGIPTVGNVHEVVAEINPAARVVYVDADAVAIAHSKALLADVPEARALYADLRDWEFVLGSREVTELFDLGRPVGVLMFSVLSFIPVEDDLAAIVARYRDATVPGSYLALSYAVRDYSRESSRRVADIYTRAGQSLSWPTSEEVGALMDGYELVEPGLVDMIRWRPDPQDPPDPLGGDVARYAMVGAVGRKGSDGPGHGGGSPRGRD